MLTRPSPTRSRQSLGAALRVVITAAVVLLLGFLLGVGIGAWRDARAGAMGSPAQVVVSIPPLEGLIRPLLDEGTSIRVLVPIGATVHGWSPTPEDARAIARADLVLTVGLGLEAGVSPLLKRSWREDRVEVVFAEAVGLIERGDAVPGHDHDHGDAAPEGAEERDRNQNTAPGTGSIDAHLWLDPVLVRELVPVLESAVVRAGLVTAEQASTRAALLLAEIDAIDVEHRERLAAFAGAGLAVDHNAYTRLFARYGLVQAAVVRPIETAEPSPEQLRRVVEAIQSGAVRALLVEPQFSRGAASRIAELTGVPIGRVDPLGTGDWMAMMRSNLHEITAVLADAGG